MNGAAIFGLYCAVLRRGWPATLLLALMIGLLFDRPLMQLMDTLTADIQLTGSMSPDELMTQMLGRVQAFLDSGTMQRSLLALSLLSLWPACALVLCAHQLAGGAVAPADGGLVAALRAYPAALLVALLFTVIISLGLMLLVIPGIWMAGALQLWVVALMARDASASQCLQASWRRVRGQWWRSNVMVTMVVLCGLGAGVLAAMVASSVAHAVAGALSLGADAQRGCALAVLVLANVIAAPTYPVALVASYRDLAVPAK